MRNGLAILWGLIFLLSTDAVAAAQTSYGIEYGTGRIICTDDADRDVDGVGDDYAAAAAWDRRVFGENTPCNAEELTDLDPGVWKQTRPFAGSDAAGRSARFRIYVLHDTYSWASGSSSRIVKQTQPASLGAIFSAPNFQQRLCDGNAAFGLGTASSDGAKTANQQLARARTETLANGLIDARDDCPVGRIPIVFGVDMGEHDERVSCPGSGNCTPALADQRRVMIIATEDITVDIDLPQALAAGLREQRVLSSLDIDNYDTFEMYSY